MANCPVCGDRIGMFKKAKTSDGVICGRCASICSSCEATSTGVIKESWSKNKVRWQMFSTTEILKSFASEIITIDEVHHFFVFGDIEKLKTIPVVFAFGEVCSYQIETAGRKTFIKKKIRIGRAADSGDAACCTDVPSGGGTSGGERKSICREGKTKINFIMYGERLQRESANYPAGFTAFLDRCIDEFRSGSNTPEIVEVSAVGEILKYKNMLDTGIITEEEFQIKKSKLLGI